MKNANTTTIIPDHKMEMTSFHLDSDVETILDSSFDGILVTDGRGVVLWVNPASAQICGVHRDKLIGKDVQELEKEGVFNPSITLMVLHDKKRITYFQDTGSGRKVLVTGSPVFDKEGNIVRVICNSRDITELLNMREQLEVAEQQASRYQSELSALRQHMDLPKHVVIESEKMRQLIAMAIRIAPKDITILILGESGVGKNALAQTIHDSSKRNSEPFIEINCGAIPEALFESELFGYESGAFTGAHKDGKQGLIELANKGTLFLNEVGELPPSMQVKLLTFLQEGFFKRVGGTKSIQADVRVIAATNRDLQTMVTNNEFREDLYYRLNVISLTIPPLRERPEDIIVQSNYYLDQFNKKHESQKQFSKMAIHAILSHPWSGNTRELKNAIERAVVISDSSFIEPEDLNLVQASNSQKIVPLRNALEVFEKDLLNRAFKIYGSTYKVAAALGISQPTIVRKSKKYKIQVNDL